MDCNFDQGACEWVQDKADDIDWSVAYHNDGNSIIIFFYNNSEFFKITYLYNLFKIHTLTQAGRPDGFLNPLDLSHRSIW